MNYQCDNCGHVGSGDTFPDARDLSQRLDEGGTYTTKECPECGHWRIRMSRLIVARQIGSTATTETTSANRLTTDMKRSRFTESLATVIADDELERLPDTHLLRVYEHEIQRLESQIDELTGANRPKRIDALNTNTP